MVLAAVITDALAGHRRVELWFAYSEVITVLRKGVSGVWQKTGI